MWSMIPTILPLVTRNLKSRSVLPQTRLSRRRPAHLLRPIFRPYLERLEDRTVPTSITVLASHLHTAGGLPEQVRVLETGTVANGNDFTFDAAPGVYHLTDYDGGGTYGSFTVATTGIISGTTGALVALSSTIDFDLTKLAAVTVYGTDLQTAAGRQQLVGVANVVTLVPGGSGTDTVYLPATTFQVLDHIGGVYGTFTVAANASGSLAVTGATGAAVATGNTIHFDVTKLAAITVYGTDLTTAAGQQQNVQVANIVTLFPPGGYPGLATDTVYLPARAYQVIDYDGVYGGFSVSATASGALAVTSPTGAAVATGNTIHLDPCRLNRVQVTPNSGMRWGIGNTTLGDSYTSDVVALGDGNYTLVLRDSSGNITYASFSVSSASGLSATQLPQGSPLVTLALVPCAPTVGPITAPLTPVPVNTAVPASASFTDPGLLETHKAVWNWGDSTTSPGSVTESNGSGTVTGSHTYAVDGVYTITLTVTNNVGGSGQSVFRYVVVYNPSAGFVTGGGWFNWPAGAYPNLTGRANFGLNAKYPSGATVPTGSTEFQFPAGNLNFHATSYDWLVITTNQAQYQGTGTINGAGNFGFLVTVLDNGGTTPDKFRMKIWDKNNNNTVIYDTQPGAASTAAPTTPLGGGRIQVHSVGGGTGGSPVPPADGGGGDPITSDKALASLLTPAGAAPFVTDSGSQGQTGSLLVAQDMLGLAGLAWQDAGPILPSSERHRVAAPSSLRAAVEQLFAGSESDWLDAAVGEFPHVLPD